MWGNNVGNFFAIPGGKNPLTRATLLPVPTTRAVLFAQLGCKGRHWVAVTIFCHVWVLDGAGPVY